MANHIIENHLDTLSFHKSLSENGVRPKTLTDSDGSCKVTSKEDDTIEFFVNNSDTYIWDKSFLDKLFATTAVGQMYISTSTPTTLTNAGTAYKLSGTFTDGSQNVSFTTLSTNKITCNKSGKYLFTGAGVMHVDKSCTITLYLYLNGSPVFSTPRGFSNSNVEGSAGKTRIINLSQNDEIEIYASSNQANTTLTVDEMEICFTEIKQY